MEVFIALASFSTLTNATLRLHDVAPRSLGETVFPRFPGALRIIHLTRKGRRKQTPPNFPSRRSSSTRKSPCPQDARSAPEDRHARHEKIVPSVVCTLHEFSSASARGVCHSALSGALPCRKRPYPGAGIRSKR